MNIVQEFPDLRAPLSRALVASGRALDDRLWQDEAFTDLFTREVHRQADLSDETRTEVYSSFIGPGPGGVLAAGWLAENDLLDEELLEEFLFCLPLGPYVAGALDPLETLEAAEGLFAGGWVRQRPMLVAHLLSARVLQDRSRQALLHRVYRAPWAGRELRQTLTDWALFCQSDELEGFPAPHSALFSPALVGSVMLGRPLNEVVRVAESRPVLCKSTLERLVEWLDGGRPMVAPRLSRRSRSFLKQKRAEGQRQVS
ncbi:MAG: hypothetical protein KC910_27415 [Candidatus Eremiobacteraeota bacterium]|nr:hypothetical protein [Candidatus Eremiobacteraeota bacterium]